MAGPRSQDPGVPRAEPQPLAFGFTAGSLAQSEAPTRGASQLWAFPAPAFIYGGNVFLLLPHPSLPSVLQEPPARVAATNGPRLQNCNLGGTDGHGDVTRTAPSPPSPALPVPPRPPARRTGAAAQPGTAWPQRRLVPAPTSARVFEEQRNERELSAHPARAGDGVGPARAASPFDKRATNPPK